MISLSQLLPHLLHQFASEADLVKAVKEISEAFTTDRNNITRYLNDPRLVSAYTAFYATTNMPLLSGAFKWLSPKLVESLKEYQLIDVGAGPGTFTMAWLDWGGVVPPVMIESSSLMREQAKKIIEDIYKFKAIFNLKEADQSKKKIMLFGQSFNEMGEAQALRLIEECDPEILFFIEPGTKEVFQQMLTLREKIQRKGWFTVFPCLSEAKCPWSGSQKDWCHQFLEVRHSVDVERLSQMAHKDRRSRPIIVHVYQKAVDHRKSESEARLVRVHPETKFSYEWQVCLPAGDELQVEAFQLMKKSLSKTEQKEVSQWNAGERVDFTEEKKLPDTRRIRLIGNN